MDLSKIKPDCRREVYHWLLITAASVVFLVNGYSRALNSAVDFTPVFTGAECVLDGCDPYDNSALKSEYFRHGGPLSTAPNWDSLLPLYPPSTLLVVSPIALLNIPHARLLWLILNSGSFIAATIIVLSTVKPMTWMTTCVAAYILATGSLLLRLGQPSTLAISFLAIGVTLLTGNRHKFLAVVSLTLTLAVKPQVGVFVVLYLFTTKIHRIKAALAIGGAAVIFLIAGMLLQSRAASENWYSNLCHTLDRATQPNNANDPRPGNREATGAINLQPVTSIFAADPRHFNLLAYAIVLVLLASLSIIANAKISHGGMNHQIAIAAVCVISLLPIYHRAYETRILILTLPALLFIRQTSRSMATFITVITVLVIVSFQVKAQQTLDIHPGLSGILKNKVLFLLVLREQNLALLALTCVYLVALASARHYSQITSPHHSDTISEDQSFLQSQIRL